MASLNKRASLTEMDGSEEPTGSSLSMVAGDFDENGVSDLIIGSVGPTNSFLSLYAGNEDALFPDNPEARTHRMQRRSGSSAALSFTRSMPVAEQPDFLASGDANGDGHLDLITAARNGKSLSVLEGDGHGYFALARSIKLPGRITTIAASEPGDLRLLAIGVVDKSGPALLLFRSLSQGSGASPAIIRLPAKATAVAFRRSPSTNSTELLIAAGSQLLVRPFDDSEAKGEREFARSFSSEIKSLVVGSLASALGSDVAVLTADGAVNLLPEGESGTMDWGAESSTLGFWPDATALLTARISGSSNEDLVVVDPGGGSLHVLIEDTSAGGDSVARPGVRGRVPVSFDVAGAPVAVLPLRLNEDALSEFAILRAGRVGVESFRISAAMTFVVINTNDSGAGSLRQAILDANANPGTDTINFNIPGPAPHTIIPLSPGLPDITESVTINGTSQPDFGGTPVVELNGLNAGAADGLTINASSCVVRGLVINRFSGNGITISGSANAIEGNFIGTTSTGTFAVGNSLDGVFISAASSNTIGGTTAAARNVIAGNRNGIQISGGGTGNQVRGDSIGTSVSGTLSLGNTANGVLISGSSNNVIGIPGSASINTIAFNGVAGVAVASGTGNSILSNSIFSNGGLGIDLGPAGVTPNDSGDGDTGANNLQNFPVINSASNVGTSTTVQGTLNSAAGASFRLEFFSNQFSNPSGFGEGQTFIGVTNVTTDASGNASFNPTFLVTVPAGQVITATATDISNNTSEFSRGVQVGGLTGGTPADLSIISTLSPIPVDAGADVTKTIIVTNLGPSTATSVTVTDVLSASLSFSSCNSTSGGVCGGTGTTRTITFASLAPGSTAIITIVAHVNCSVPNGTVIGNTATVFSSSTPDANPTNNMSTGTTVANNPPPRITCPANVTQSNDTGKCSATVNYATPVVLDNCTGAGVICSPPSGASFSIGTTTVSCIATDAAGATANCSFTVTVNDTEPIAISCPSNVVITAPPGQCSPVVNFPAPTVIDNCPGGNVTCLPPSGSSFPLGVTNVRCTAVDAKGGQASCGFTVTVTGSPLALVHLEGNRPNLDFGPVPAARKIKKLKKQRARNFTIENIGCLPLVLTFDSLSRIGSDVDRGRIGDPDDRGLFTLYLVDDSGVQTELEILSDVRINSGEKQNFRVRFHPVIPTVANETRGLPADQVLPDLITSRITFAQSAGPPVAIDLVGHLDTAVTLTDPDNPRVGPTIVFSRVENDFIIEYTIYDSNLDINKATYQFFDSHNRPVGQLISVDLSSLIQQAGFVTGQSFTVSQRISGAEGHGEIVGVAVTVLDGESSDTASSTFAASPIASANALDRINSRGWPTRLYAPARRLPVYADAANPVR